MPQRLRSSPRIRLPVLALLALGASAACSSSKPSPRAQEPHAPSAQAAQTGEVPAMRLLAPARLVPLPRAECLVGHELDGGRRYLVAGMRMIERTDGTIACGEELLASSTRPEVRELPARLGGGFLFTLRESSSTYAWRAETFTGTLEPLANLGFVAERIVEGFDRLYFSPRRSNRLVALDPSDGKALPLGPLPAAPAYADLAMADEWLGAVIVPIRGPLVTFDAGASWHPVPLQDAERLSADRDGVAIEAKSGRYVLDSSGALRFGQSSALPEADRAASQTEQPSGTVGLLPEARRLHQRLGDTPLRLAVLRGYLDSAETAVVAQNGVLARVGLSDGSLLDLDERAFSGGTCQAFRFRKGFGFACDHHSGTTDVYAFEPPLSLTKVASYPGLREIMASHTGGIVVRGGCAGPDGHDRARFCVLPKDGSSREVTIGVERAALRVAVLSDGRFAALSPPTARDPGWLSVTDAAGVVEKVVLRLPTDDGAPIALLRNGLWLHGLFELESGELGGFVDGGGDVVGVRVALDGRVQAAAAREARNGFLASGPLAFVLQSAAPAAQSIDGGFTWHTVDIPIEPGERPREEARVRVEQGCSPVGCAFGRWLRLGWNLLPSEWQPEAAARAEPTRELGTPNQRWNLTCSPTGTASRPVSQRDQTRRPFTRTSVETDSISWPPLAEVEPPTLTPGLVGFDHGTSRLERVQGRAYAFGPRAGDWQRWGRFQVRATDRFSLSSAIWSSAVGRSPWPDAATAAQALGHDRLASVTNLSIALDPSGRAGAALITAGQGRAELFVVEQGRVPVRVENVVAEGITSLHGVVKVEQTLYVGSVSSTKTFRVHMVAGRRLERVAEYPLNASSGVGHPLSAEVVRSSRADALAIWIRSHSQYVYPVERESGTALTPLVVEPRALSRMPRPCGFDDAGWVLTSELGAAPHVTVPDAYATLHPFRFEARMLASQTGVCTEGLAAQTDRDVPLPPGAAEPAGGGVAVPLVLTAREQGGRRYGFVCSQ